jgi:hypothetical protein
MSENQNKTLDYYFQILIPKFEKDKRYASIYTLRAVIEAFILKNEESYHFLSFIEEDKSLCDIYKGGDSVSISDKKFVAFLENYKVQTELGKHIKYFFIGFVQIKLKKFDEAEETFKKIPDSKGFLAQLKKILAIFLERVRNKKNYIINKKINSIKPFGYKKSLISAEICFLLGSLVRNKNPYDSVFLFKESYKMFKILKVRKEVYKGPLLCFASDLISLGSNKNLKKYLVEYIETYSDRKDRLYAYISARLSYHYMKEGDISNFKRCSQESFQLSKKLDLKGKDYSIIPYFCKESYQIQRTKLENENPFSRKIPELNEKIIALSREIKKIKKTQN